ncbi:MAG: hypothetical protein ABIV26_00020 [Candidatus Limnocylindrales bacterium]
MLLAWNLTLRRVSGLSLALAAPATLAIGAASFVLLPIVVPLAVLQAVAGIKVLAGRLRWRWAAVPCALLSSSMALATVSGFAAPVAWAAIALNSIGIAAALFAQPED